MTTMINGIDGLRAKVGEHLGYSDWYEVTQGQIDRFADATGDHQWIHIDPERAQAGPFGTTIAHGYLTLSLLPSLLPQILQVTGVAMGVNYGTNKVRFPSPVPSGSFIQLSATLAQVTDVAGGVQAAIDAVITVRDAAKPSLVAQALFNYYS
jgi:acyl dehydratase